MFGFHNHEANSRCSATFGVGDDQRSDLLNSILDHFPGGIAVFDEELRMTVCNDKLKVMLDYPDHLFDFGMPTMEQIFRFNASRGEYGKGNIEHLVAARLDLARKKEAHVYERKRPNGLVLEVRGTPIKGGGFLTTYVDISLQRGQVTDHSLNSEKGIDKLTGLATAKALEHTLDNLLRLLQPGEVACLHCIDLDRFTKINERYGTVVGDFLLKEIASRLANLTRGTDYIARTGGDRFQVLQVRIAKPSDVTRLASRMVDAIKVPIRCGDLEITVGASVGFSIVNHDTRSVDAVIGKANSSVLSVKNRRSQYPHESSAA